MPVPVLLHNIAPALTGGGGLFAFQGVGNYIGAMLTRKHTVIGGCMVEDDWSIFFKRRYVGRIYGEMRTNPSRKEWFWTITAPPAAYGYCATWEEAAAALKAELASRGIE